MMESKEDILIIINKNSGNQHADTVLNNSVLPYLSHICVGYQLIYTQKNKNDIADFKNHPGTLNIRVFSKFMIIGGDGTVFDFIQNLLTCDEFDLLNIPIIIIPCGSGNALAKNIGINTIQDGIDSINSKKIIKPYLSSIIQDDKFYYSFLGITWGLIPSIDIETEHLRWLSNYRFYYGILKNIISMKNVFGKVILYTYPDDKKEIIEGNFSLFCAMQLPWISNDFLICPDKDVESKYFSIIYILDKQLSFLDRLRLFYYFQRGDHLENLDYIVHKKISSYQIIPDDKDSLITCDGELLENKPVSILKTSIQMNLLSPPGIQ